MRSVIRSRPLQTFMARLAWLAIALMLCAPLLSRALQAQGPPALAELCTSAGLKRIDLGLLNMSASHSAAPAAADSSHGADAACDYCLLAIRLLPLLALILALLPLQRTMRAPLRELLQTSNARAWPAHPVRGPPLAA